MTQAATTVLPQVSPKETVTGTSQGRAPELAGTVSRIVQYRWDSGDTSAAAANHRLTTLRKQDPAVSQRERFTSLRSYRPVGSTFRRLEMREGFVVEVRDGDFSARLIDPAGIEADEEVDVETDQISPADVPLIRVGALFYWAIGHLTVSGGRRQLVLRIEFQRLPSLNSEDEHIAREKTVAMLEDFGWN